MTPPSSSLTHADLVRLAAKWLRKTVRCGAVITEVGGTSSLYGEIPDAIGWKKSYSIVIECKVSRADFFADAEKPFRVNPKHGMGTYRYYLTAPGLLKHTDVLESGWGILETPGKKILTRVPSTHFEGRSLRAESRLMYTALQRVQYRINRPLAEVVSWDARGVMVDILDPDPVEKVEYV